MDPRWLPYVMDHLRSLGSIPFNVEGHSVRPFALVAQQAALREGLRRIDAFASIAFIDAKFAAAADG